MKSKPVSIFVGHFCPPGSGYRSLIRIHTPDPFRIGSETLLWCHIGNCFNTKTGRISACYTKERRTRREDRGTATTADGMGVGGDIANNFVASGFCLVLQCLVSNPTSFFQVRNKVYSYKICYKYFLTGTSMRLFRKSRYRFMDPHWLHYRSGSSLLSWCDSGSGSMQPN